ncbi:ribosome biogenesis protein GTPase YqeH [Clostridium sp. CAG:1000]|jgi:ribosome biogenesis GTPase A|nr:50S ribosome-binding GTPase [Clostridium sp.]CCX36101.1 ribosome biogenesis protein GTPase YqeH [Clostridium sp. CAG:1000]
MTKECLGCGCVLQTIAPKEEGFVKSSVLSKADYCERCFKIKHYGEYSVLDKKIDTDGIIRNINSDNLASVAILIDALNINDNIKKYIKRFKNKKYILITKKDILPKSLKEKKLIEYIKNNVCDTENIMCISSVKNYNIDNFLNKIKEDNVKRLYIVGFTNSGKSTFINHLLTSQMKNPTITTSAIPNTTASYITIKLDNKITIVDTPGFIDSNAVYNFIDYNKTIKLYPKKEIRVKTFQIRSGYSIVINDILRIDNLGKCNSFSFYMSDKLRYEKVKFKNEKLKILPSISIETNECTDVLVNGLGFIRITKPGEFKIYALDEKMISIRKSMI